MYPVIANQSTDYDSLSAAFGGCSRVRICGYSGGAIRFPPHSETDSHASVITGS